MITGLFLTLFLVFLNGFFVAAEFAIVKVRASKIEIYAKKGGKVAKMAKHILANLDQYLAATQLGITLASLGLGWVGEETFEHIIRDALNLFGASLPIAIAHKLSFVLAFLIITLLHIIFGELAPKSLAIQRSTSTTLFVAVPLQMFYYLFRPLIWVMNATANLILKVVGIDSKDKYEAHHSAEELHYLIDQSKEGGAIDSSEHEMIKNVFDFNERLAKNIMVPRTKISAIEISTLYKEVLEKMLKEGYSRMPIYQGSIDKIVGIIHVKDILPLLFKGEGWVLKNIMRKVYYVPETKKINDLLSEMQAKRIQMAIVLDEFGGTAGMVTLEDIMEELVGEIQDEHDEERPIVEQIVENEFIVNASASIYDVNEFLPHDLPENEDYDTIAGLVGHTFEKIPDIGEEKEFGGYLITVIKKVDNNIETIKLVLLRTKEDSVDLR